MFRAMFPPIIRSTCLYLQYLVVFTQSAAGCVSNNLKLNYVVCEACYTCLTNWVNTTRYCKYNQVLLMIDENIA
jgi:hypothetical protein